MKKFTTLVWILSGILCLSASCNKTPTYADRLKEESKAIKRFMKENKFIELKDFPKDTIFKENEFYRDPATGVYFNIIDRGAHEDKAHIGEEIYVRFKGLKFFMKDDSTTYNNLNPNTSPYPQTIIYRGPVNMMNSALYSDIIAGWVVPIPYIGHSGQAKLIVPFNMGGASEKQHFQPTYYEKVQYRFETQ